MPKQLKTSRPVRRRAFTLIEVLVSVGAAALVAVGIAAIFESVGKTVSGGKRVSQFNAYSALLEQQLRQDFSQMTREGFLVIRQQYAGLTPGSPPPPEPPSTALAADDTAPRPRRVDEIMFFTTGEYATAREPMHPYYIGRANAARIYYGHGARMSPANPSYTRPEPFDKPRTGDSTWVLGQDGPNKYAADWTLLRHVTLLAPPRSATSYPALPPPGQLFGRYPASGARASDQGTQIALQPAAASLFRQLNARVFPLPLPGGPAQALLRTIRGDYAAYQQNPVFMSGLVDICTTSDQAWPAQSDPTFGALAMVDPVPGARMRYEPTPPDYLGVLSQPLPREEEEAYRRIDQTMLTASNLLPRCTEFIVEWSFGQVDDDTSSPTYGELIWYGLDRRVDKDADGVTTGTRDGYAARPYPYKATVAGTQTALLRLPYRRADGKIADGAPGNPQPVPVDPQLINGYGIIGLPSPTYPLTNYFGYVDPTFNPAGPDGTAGNGDDPVTPRPWAWPRLIRVTVTIADAQDPKIEESFQFVIETPGTPAS